MKKTDLLDSFIDVLNQKTPKRSELISQIADILKIEKESASRRMSGKVQFTIREMGILAQEMNILIDALIQPDQNYTPIFFRMDNPRIFISMNDLIDSIEANILELQIGESNDQEMGMIFASLPVEFFIPYPTLCKFMYFKWGHHFIGSKEFEDFTSWKLPEKLNTIHYDIMKFYRKYRNIYYIWDRPVIWNLMKDIRYFNTIHILTPEDVFSIKKDVLQMLNDVENMANGTRESPLNNGNIEIYISSLNIGISSIYYSSEEYYFSLFNTYFLHSAMQKGEMAGEKVKAWIHSLKKISTLISGSGEKERMLFFEEQRQILDQI